MRLIVNHRDFPFRRDTRLGRAVDLAILVLLTALLLHAVRSWVTRPTGHAAPAVAAPIARQLVLTIHTDGRWTLDGQLLLPDDATADIRRAFADRTVKVLFVEAAPERTFGEVLAAAEAGRAAGVRTVGFLPTRHD